MKKVYILFFVMVVSLFASSNEVKRGQTYYQYILKPMLGYNGAVFAKKHTKKEWQKLFLNEAAGFKKEFQGVSDRLDAFMNQKKFYDIRNDLKAFVIYYAKDASVTPSCQE